MPSRTGAPSLGHLLFLLPDIGICLRRRKQRSIRSPRMSPTMVWAPEWPCPRNDKSLVQTGLAICVCCVEARSVLMASIFFLFASCSPLIFAGTSASAVGGSRRNAREQALRLVGLHLGLLLPGAICLRLPSALLREQEARHGGDLLGPGHVGALLP